MDYSSEIRDPCVNSGSNFDFSESDALDLEIRGFVEKDFQLEPFDVNNELEEMRRSAAHQEAWEVWAAEKRPEGAVDEQSEFFKKRNGMTEVARGVFMKSVNEGFGPKVEPGFLVSVHYKMEQDGCSRPVDDSSKHDVNGRAQPWIFRVDTGTVIPCFDIVVQRMRQGETVEAFVMPDVAYNTVSKDHPLTNARIKKEQPIFLTLTVTDVIANREAREVYDMSENELKKADFEKVYRAAVQQKDCGNNYYKNGQFEEAHGRYKLGLDWLLSRNPETVQEDETKKRDLVALLLTNMAIVNLKAQYPKGAKKFAVEAVKYADSSDRKVKALYNAARACRVLNEFEEALGHVREGLRVKRERALVDEHALILEKLKVAKMDEKVTCRKMFSSGALDSGEKEGEGKSDEYPMDDGVKDFILDVLIKFVLDPKESSMVVPEIGLNPFQLHFMETKAMELGLKCLYDDFQSLVGVEKPEGYKPPE